MTNHILITMTDHIEITFVVIFLDVGTTFLFLIIPIFSNYMQMNISDIQIMAFLFEGLVGSI